MALELHMFHDRRVVSKSIVRYAVSGKNPLISTIERKI